MHSPEYGVKFTLCGKNAQTTAAQSWRSSWTSCLNPFQGLFFCRTCWWPCSVVCLSSTWSWHWASFIAAGVSPFGNTSAPSSRVRLEYLTELRLLSRRIRVKGRDDIGRTDLCWDDSTTTRLQSSLTLASNLFVDSQYKQDSVMEIVTFTSQNAICLRNLIVCKWNFVLNVTLCIFLKVEGTWNRARHLRDWLEIGFDVPLQVLALPSASLRCTLPSTTTPSWPGPSTTSCPPFAPHCPGPPATIGGTRPTAPDTCPPT